MSVNALHPLAPRALRLRLAALAAACFCSVALAFDDDLVGYGALPEPEAVGFYERATGRYHADLRSVDETLASVCTFARGRNVDLDWERSRHFGRRGPIASLHRSASDGPARRPAAVANAFAPGAEGLAAAELEWLNLDAAPEGSLGSTWDAPRAGCHWFGGYPTNPFAAMWMRADALAPDHGDARGN
ncbi:MAG: hypothetical protein IT453_19575 [Planctomycetes bacterium]|nr:hypothetical protein [Planctomycetota bacterium]